MPGLSPQIMGSYYASNLSLGNLCPGVVLGELQLNDKNFGNSMGKGLTRGSKYGIVESQTGKRPWHLGQANITSSRR